MKYTQKAMTVNRGVEYTPTQRVIEKTCSQVLMFDIFFILIFFLYFIHFRL